MQKIAVITDTNASLPAEILHQWGIIAVPIQIQFGDRSFTTGVDIDDSSLFELIDAGKTLPTTAAPAPDTFENAFRAAFAAGHDQALCICCSEAVSATCQAARIASEAFPEGSVVVVDSQMLSLAEGFQALTAAQAARQGVPLDEILSELDAQRGHAHVYAALPTLKYLVMGGRMGKLTAGFAETLSIKPILAMREGKLDLLEKVRTWGKAKQRLVELATRAVGMGPVRQLGLVHVNNEAGARALYDELLEAVPGLPDPVIAAFSPGLSAHAGSGVIGIAVVTA